MENCLHCQQLVNPKEAKLWRWVGWAVHGPAPCAPIRLIGKKRDMWDWIFHKDCFSEWLENRNGYLQDLDKPVNNCCFFERTGSSIHGYYVREGKKHACLATWLESDILGSNLFPTVIEGFRLDFDFISVKIGNNTAFIESFRSFLKKHDWFGPKWYEPRKEYVVKNDIANRRQNENDNN